MTVPDTEYSEEFDKLRRNRTEVSYFKYGSAKDNFGKKLVNALESAEMCKQKYLETGNTEYLLDMANYVMFEFMYPSRPDAHFEATDSKDSAGISGISIREMEDFKENE